MIFSKFTNLSLCKFISSISITPTPTTTSLSIFSSLSSNINSIRLSRTFFKMAEQSQDLSLAFKGIRLPNDLVPKHYDLKLTPNLEKFTFQGTVKVELSGKSSNKLNEIALHANEIQIEEGYANEEKYPLKKVVYNQENETANLLFGEDVKEIKSLFLKFNGTLNDKMKGFYRTSFKLADQTVYAATTQFEATDARRCFPCWDEPSFKATFDVTLVYPSNLTALSNMPIEKEGQADIANHSYATYQKTPIMSTYLLAFIVGPFEYIESSDGKRPIRVYTTPGKKDQGQFALEVACKSLPYYEEYFGVKYPLPKMDLIALPDFASGAMENWGLVTYRETCLLVDPKNTSTTTKQWVALVVAHELAHQWFGNLVTMEWWTHLWLNEGFASFMEFLCVDHIFPEYDIWSQFTTDTYSTALELDALHNSHPIEVEVNHPSEIDEIFDSISYNKGASVIRMLYTYIGDDYFKKGMKDYLTRFAYKNAVTEDLWDALGAASNKPVREIMSGWTSQKGFPWLSVDIVNDGDKAKLSLIQSKFSADGKLPPEDEKVTWMVPISAMNSKKETFSDLLKAKSGSLVVDGVGDSWLKLNSGSIGLYRTAYPKDMVAKLHPAVSNKTLQPMDRLGLQNDYFALCQAGKVSTVELMKLLQAFKKEDNYTVWKSINACLGRLDILFANTDYLDEFHKYGVNLLSDIFETVTWTPKPNESHSDAILRALVVNRLVSFGDQKVISEALKMFETEFILPDLRAAVYKAVSSYGTDQQFDKLFAIYKSADLQEEKNRTLGALGFTKHETRRARVISFVLSDEVRNQDKVFGIGPIGFVSPPAAWKLFTDQKDAFRSAYETGHLMTRLIRFCTENFASEQMATEIEKFFAENKFPGAERTIQQSLETIRLNANWLNRDSDSVKAFLSSKPY